MLNVSSVDSEQCGASLLNTPAGSCQEVRVDVVDYVNQVLLQLVSSHYRIALVQLILDVAPQEEVTGSKVWASSRPVCSKVFSDCVVAELADWDTITCL